MGAIQVPFYSKHWPTSLISIESYPQVMYSIVFFPRRIFIVSLNVLFICCAAGVIQTWSSVRSVVSGKALRKCSRIFCWYPMAAMALRYARAAPSPQGLFWQHMDLVQTDLLLPKYCLVLYTLYSTCCYMVLSQTSDAKPSVYPNHLNGQKIGAHPPLLNKPVHFLCSAAVAQSGPISSCVYYVCVCVSYI